MSIKNIISEIASFGKDVIKDAAEDVLKDLAAAQNLDPVVLVAGSALEAATTDDSFQDRVVHNAKEGFQALSRLGEKFARYSGGRGLFHLWTGPQLPSVIIRDLPLSLEQSEKYREVLLQYAEPAIEESWVSESLVNQMKIGAEAMQKAGVTPEEFPSLGKSDSE